MPIKAWTIALLVISSAFSTIVAWLFSRQKLLSGMTVPFILSVWLLLVGCHIFAPSLLLPSSVSAESECIDVFQASGLSIGQVMFQGRTIVSGLLFFIAILINSRINAVYTMLGALLPIPAAMLLGAHANDVNAGLLGYNGVLCAIALGNNKMSGAVSAVAAVLLSVLIQYSGMCLSLITLTAPFVVSVWIVALANKYIFK